MIIEGAVNEQVFTSFVEGLILEMNPYPGKNSVLVLDNVKFAEAVRDLLEEA